MPSFNIHELFNIFEKVAKTLGYSDNVIMAGGCEIAFSEFRETEAMKKVAKEYDLTLNEFWVMGCINLEVCTDTEELLPQIVDSVSDPIEFILDIDSYVADEGFTLELIRKLAENLAEEYKRSSDHVTEKVVEQEFGGNNDDQPRYMSWSADDIENYENAHKAMMDIVEITNRLSY